MGHGFFGKGVSPMSAVQRFIFSIHHGHDLTGDTVDSSEISAKLVQRYETLVKIKFHNV